MNELQATSNTTTQVHSILGESRLRIPTVGKIRSGIKVLTKRFQDNERALKIYDYGVANGYSFAAIEKRIRRELNLDKSPMTPRNVPYFTVHKSDFADPSVAQRLMDLYAQEREDGVHIYRLPIIFPSDNWLMVMPHSLKTYTRSELVYWSDYNDAGQRRCLTREKIQVDERSRRAVRPFGGRRVIERPDNGGACEPEKCPQYQSRECNLTGEFIFYVPGVTGAGAFSLPTRSYYSMEQARSVLQMVSYLRRGRISGLHQGKPIFWLSKKQGEVSMIDPMTGEPKRVRQWLIELETDIDMASLFERAETDAIADGRRGAAMLGAPDDDAEFDGVESGESADDELPESPDQEAPAATEAPREAPEQPADPEVPQNILDLRERITEALGELSIEEYHWSLYAADRIGRAWDSDEGMLNQCLDVLEQAADNEQLHEEIAKFDDVPF